MKFSFRPLSDSGIVTLAASESGQKKEEKSQARKTQQSRISWLLNFGSHD